MKNLDTGDQENIRTAEELIQSRALVKYQVSNEDLTICVELNDIDNIIGIVVGNVKYSEVKWIYDSDLYSVETEVKEERTKVNQIFDYLFGPSLFDKNKNKNNPDEKEKELPAPSMSIDALIDKALSKLSGIDSLYNTHWTLSEEDAAIREYLDDEANNLQPDPAKDNTSLPDDAITGWVRVAWPDKGITTVEHVSFLRRLV